MSKKFLSSADVAKLVGVGQVTIWQWCRRGLLPHWRFNRTLRFDPMEVDAFVNAARMGLVKVKGSDEGGAKQKVR